MILILAENVILLGKRDLTVLAGKCRFTILVEKRDFNFGGKRNFGGKT